ncbi:ATP-binding protein [Defluviitalea saccharophila]|uniref:ATP-binding protein n=1 Tax=Defluviitalea saccharophila TaxID=879970 RepID=A0ABZ2Y2S8_9FIRM
MEWKEKLPQGQQIAKTAIAFSNGATNKLADEEMIFELERQRRNVSFDEEIEYNYDEANLNIDKFITDFKRYTDRVLKYQDLINLKMYKQENGKLYPTRAAILLSDESNFFEYAKIKCARFKGTTVEEFIDSKEFKGPLYEQVENAVNFAKMYIARNGVIEDLQRKDTYEIPIVAIREAIVNAVVHRDYSISGSDVTVAIFDDRIEITSPGVLPKSLSIEDIKKGRSEIRNRVLARVFKEMNLIEQWGTGIQRIYQRTWFN